MRTARSQAFCSVFHDDKVLVDERLIATRPLTRRGRKPQNDSGRFHPLWRYGEVVPVAEKQTVPIFGQNISATEVSVVKADEKVNEYELEDGSVIRFRVVATSILRIDDQYDAEGNPIYLVKNGQIVTVIKAGDRVRRKVN